jgi:hypothetical protein
MWALAEHLSLLVPTDRVGLPPWSQMTVIDQQVLLEVTEFDRTMGRGGAGGALASAGRCRPGADDAQAALVQGLIPCIIKTLAPSTSAEGC